jgi:uncharacterized repeat protein (TIGR03803 family)
VSRPSPFLLSLIAATAISTSAHAQTVTAVPIDAGPDVIVANDGNYYSDGIIVGANNCPPSDLCVFRTTPQNLSSALNQQPIGPGVYYAGYYGVMQGIDGNFYAASTVSANGTNGGGVIQIAPDGTYQYLGYFEAYSELGAEPGGVLQGSDGNFYSLLQLGGSNQFGTIVRITPSGTTTTLYTFQGKKDGMAPSGQLLEASDGNFYGYTNPGDAGANRQNASIFRLTPSGQFKTLYVSSNHEAYIGGFVEGPDGALHGAINYPTGQWFSMTLAGDFTIQTTFSWPYEAGFGSPFLAGDGNYYLVTDDLQQITPSGKFTALGVSDIYSEWLTDDSNGGLVQMGTDFTFDPPLTPSVDLQLSTNSIKPNTPVTLTWKVHNGFSKTLQLCSANTTDNAGGTPWTGTQTGTVKDGSYRGSAVVTPTTVGYNVYALTCGGRESGFALLVVNNGKKYTTTTTATAVVGNQLSQPIFAAQATPIDFTFSVATSGSLPSKFPQGPLTVSVNGTAVGTAPIAYGKGTYALDTTNMLPGNYNVTLAYNGDAFDAASQLTLPVTIGPNVYVEVTLFPYPYGNQEPYAEALQVNLNLEANVAVTGGTLTLSANGKTLLSSPYPTNGLGVTKTFQTLGLPLSTYKLTATYSGQPGVSPASTTQLVTLVPAPTITTLTTSASTVTSPGSVTLTATVIRSYLASAGFPAGKVTFRYKNKTIGSATLNSSGIATFTASSKGIAAGKYSLTATYDGDSTDVTSTSSPVSVTVK